MSYVMVSCRYHMYIHDPPGYLFIWSGPVVPLLTLSGVVAPHIYIYTLHMNICINVYMYV